jgi:hypothetical protein
MGVTFIGIRHWGKDTTRGAKARGMGSQAWEATARGVIAMHRNPAEPESNSRVLVPVKCNLVPDCDRLSLQFRIASWSDDQSLPVLTEFERSDVTAKDISGLEPGSSATRGHAHVRCRDAWKIYARASQAPVKTITAQHDIAQVVGCGLDTVRKVQADMKDAGELDIRQAGFQGAWYIHPYGGSNGQGATDD